MRSVMIIIIFFMYQDYRTATFNNLITISNRLECKINFINNVAAFLLTKSKKHIKKLDKSTQKIDSLQPLNDSYF